MENVAFRAESIPIRRCEVMNVQGRPLVGINGVPCFFACHYIRNYEHDLRDAWPRGVADSVRQFTSRGIHRFEITIRNGWTEPGFNPSGGPGGYPVERVMAAVLEEDPEAQVILRLGTTPPKAWVATHPDELECDGAGKSYEVSFASDTGFAAIADALATLVRFIEAGTFAGHVAGYNLGIQFEGVPCGSASAAEDAFTDYSPAMRSAFAAFLRRRYGNEKTLRQAWGDPSVRLFDAVTPPTPDEHLGGDRRFVFHHPVRGRKVRDYYDLMDELTVRRHRQLASAVKEACGGRKLVGVLGGYVQDAGEPRSIGSPMGFPQIQLHKHHFSGPGPWGRVFEAPEIDFFFAPTDYLNTAMGGNCLILNMPASQRLHGKLSFIEDDQRTHLHRRDNWNPMLKDVRESVVAHRRNAALLYTEADLNNWMEQADNWLLEPGILDNLGALNRLLQTSVHAPGAVPDAICVLIDEDSEGWTKPTTLLDEVLFYHQRNEGLSHCGVPVRYHLLSDLAHDDFPSYKCYLIPNLYRATAEKTAWLNAKLRRDGNLLIWMYGTGYVGEEDFSTDAMFELTGIRLRAHPYPYEHRVGIVSWRHPITQNLAGDLVYGTSRHYAPIFHVEDEEATILGRSLGFGMTRWPTLAIKEFGRGARGRGPGELGPGDYASVYSEAPNLPADLLRGLARYAGCHVYLETNDILTVGKDLVMMHSARPGPRTLRLPRQARVSDALTRAILAVCAAEVDFTLESPDTRLFRIQEGDQARE